MALALLGPVILRPLFLAKLALLGVAILAACGGGAGPSPGLQDATQDASAASSPAIAQSPAGEPKQSAEPVARIWKKVNWGWVSPLDGNEVGAFEKELRGFVITTQEELDRFQENAVIRISRGTAVSLGRVDFPDTVLIAAYYLWRPLQGDPLSVVGLSIEGQRADVLLELEESAQGKKYPYLLGPMAMVAVDRSNFPKKMPIDFVFHLNGEELATVTASID